MSDNKFSSDITDEESKIEHQDMSENGTAFSENKLDSDDVSDDSDGENVLAALHA